MSVVYTFTVEDPNNVGPFPPSVTASDWAKNIATYLEANSLNQKTGTTTKTILIFSNTDAANSFVSTYTLTDAGLIADINAWKSAHSITYTTNWTNETVIDLATIVN